MSRKRLDCVPLSDRRGVSNCRCACLTRTIASRPGHPQQRERVVLVARRPLSRIATHLRARSCEPRWHPMECLLAGRPSRGASRFVCNAGMRAGGWPSARRIGMIAVTAFRAGQKAAVCRRHPSVQFNTRPSADCSCRLVGGGRWGQRGGGSSHGCRDRRTEGA
jgi:hypothetical protein